MKLHFVTASGLVLFTWTASPAAAQSQAWIRQFGTPSRDLLECAGPDGMGGVFVGGSTLGSLGGPYVGSGDAWIARYDGAGNQTWIRQLGSTLFDQASCFAPDGSGGMFVAGITGGALATPQATGNVWMARYDSGGNQIWIRQFGLSWYDAVYSAAPDGTGGFYLSGEM
ncbi:MAG: hypothetical protein ABIP42_11990, partial [Planctomycetota bacterium]